MRTPSNDSASLHDVLASIMEAKGRGALTWLSNQLGMTPSAMRKRLMRPRKAFDAVTMRAVLLVAGSKKEGDDWPEPEKSVDAGNYRIDFYRVDGELTPFWSAIPEPAIPEQDADIREEADRRGKASDPEQGRGPTNPKPRGGAQA